jgi:hypothetical protein
MSEALIEAVDAKQSDELVPDPRVAKQFGKCLMTLHRWDRDPRMIALGWPAPVKIRNRKYRPRRSLEEFKETLVRRSLEERSEL